MEVKANLSAIALSVFDGTNYQMWAIRMETHLEALDLWEAMEEEYDVLVLPKNPTVAQMKSYQEKKTRKSKAKAVYLQQSLLLFFTRIMSLKTAK